MKKQTKQVIIQECFPSKSDVVLERVHCYLVHYSLLGNSFKVKKCALYSLIYDRLREFESLSAINNSVQWKHQIFM